MGGACTSIGLDLPSDCAQRAGGFRKPHGSTVPTISPRATRGLWGQTLWRSVGRPRRGPHHRITSCSN